ncbi:MAG TPA: hypothetical protein VGL89_13400 [Candidatus Koribacter sp.]|jgi:hypothetical protein
MPLRVEINDAQRLVRSEYSGTVRLEDFRENMRALATHPNFDPAYNEIIDLTGVTNVHAPPELLDMIANHPSVFAREAMRVIVAPTTVLFGLARELQMLGEDMHPNLSVVKSLADAYRVLNLPATD